VATAVGIGVPLLVTALGGSARLRHEPAVGSAGMRIHVDPTTGVLRSAPAAAPFAAATSTSARGLAERPAPRGGVMVDLQGRFRSAVTARVAADGTVVTECHTGGTAR
jgi:hypothetical protein